MRNKDLITGLFGIFWIVFLLVIPIIYGLKEHLWVISMFAIAIFTLIGILPGIIVEWYDGYESSSWLDKKIKIKLKNEKYFY